jgi:hypothetical protein
MFPRSAVGSVVGIGGMAGSAGAVLFSLSTGWVLQLTHSCTPLFVVAAPLISLAFSFSALSRQACSEWTSQSPRKTLGFETHANRLRAAVAQFARDRTRLPRRPGSLPTKHLRRKPGANGKNDCQCCYVADVRGPSVAVPDSLE